MGDYRLHAVVGGRLAGLAAVLLGRRGHRVMVTDAVCPLADQRHPGLSDLDCTRRLGRPGGAKLVPGRGRIRLALSRSLPRLALAAAGSLAASLLVIGCGSAHPGATASAPPRVPVLSQLRAVSGPATWTYAGPVTGTAAFLGIVAHGTRTRAYLCDGTPRKAGTLADWFTGPLAAGTLHAVSSQHRLRLTARLTRRGGGGTVTLPGGTAVPFTIPPIAPGRRAGVFKGTARWHGRSYQAGWIILPGGQERGAAFYPSGPIRGLLIAISNYPVGPI